MSILRSSVRFLREQWKIIRTDRLAAAGVFVVLFFGVIAILGPHITPYPPNQMVRDASGTVHFLSPPTAENWFGTTNLGRDVFSQVIAGTRVAFMVGIFAALLVTFIGANIGLLAGYYGGRFDSFLMRVVDIAYTIPFEPFVIILVSLLRPSVWNIIIAMTLIMWRQPARVIRSQVMSLSQRPFIKAAKVAGASDLRILYVHIAPNILPLIFLYVAITVGWAITAEASVSFLGFGDPRVISWGQMLQMAFVTGALRQAWWWTLPPGLCITVMVVAVFLISRAYEKYANPRLHE